MFINEASINDYAYWKEKSVIWVYLKEW
jgi:hypothetical protein